MAIARRWSVVPEGNQTVLVMLSMRGFLYIYTHIYIHMNDIYICMYDIYIYIIVSYFLYLVFEFEVYLYHCQVALVSSAMFDRDTPYADPFGIDLSGMDGR